MWALFLYEVRVFDSLLLFLCSLFHNRTPTRILVCPQSADCTNTTSQRIYLMYVSKFSRSRPTLFKSVFEIDCETVFPFLSKSSEAEGRAGSGREAGEKKR